VALRAECDRLRAEAAGAREQTAYDERRSLFQSLAQMLVQLPSVRKAVQDGADLRARDLLPLLAPLDGALRQMGIEPIGEVGGQAAFDPALHQPAAQGVVLTEGQSVRIKFVGYRMGETLLRRAQVEPVSDSVVA
jgi:molecular chaperone GrpE (heat shock protein)